MLADIKTLGFRTSVMVGLLTGLVAGCGGGSGDNSSGGSGATAQKLMLESRLRDSNCSYVTRPNSQTRVIVHKTDGSIAATFQTDAQGLLSTDWPRDGKHVTIINKEANGAYQLVTTLNVTSPDLGVFTNTDSAASSCSCTQLAIDWSSIHAAMPEYDLFIAGEQQAKSRFVSSPSIYRVCPDNSQRFGQLQLMLVPDNQGPSYLAELDATTLVNQATVSLSMGQFSQAGHPLTISSNVSSGSYTSFTPSSVGRAREMRVSMTEATPLRVFDRAGVKSAVMASSSKTEDGLWYYSAQRIAVGASDSNLQIDVPQIRDEMLMKLQAVLINAGDANKLSYDFASLGNYTTMNLQLSNSASDWLIEGPSKGTIPDLRMPADVQAVLDGNDDEYEITFGLYRYDPSWDYATFQKKLAQRSRNLGVEASGEFIPYTTSLLTINSF